MIVSLVLTVVAWQFSGVCATIVLEDGLVNTIDSIVDEDIVVQNSTTLVLGDGAQVTAPSESGSNGITVQDMSILVSEGGDVTGADGVPSAGTGVFVQGDGSSANIYRGSYVGGDSSLFASDALGGHGLQVDLGASAEVSKGCYTGGDADSSNSTRPSSEPDSGAGILLTEESNVVISDLVSAVGGNALTVDGRATGNAGIVISQASNATISKVRYAAGGDARSKGNGDANAGSGLRVRSGGNADFFGPASLFGGDAMSAEGNAKGGSGVHASSGGYLNIRNGCSIEATGGNALSDSGNAEGGQGVLASAGGQVYLDGGRYKGGSATSTVGNTTGGAGIQARSDASVIIHGGTFEGGARGAGIQALLEASVVIHGGTFEGGAPEKLSLVLGPGGGNAEVTGGLFKGDWLLQSLDPSSPSNLTVFGRHLKFTEDSSLTGTLCDGQNLAVKVTILNTTISQLLLIEDKCPEKLPSKKSCNKPNKKSSNKPSKKNKPNKMGRKPHRRHNKNKRKLSKLTC